MVLDREALDRVRLVALDIDGTLIGDDHEVSERTVSAIKDLINRGRHVALVSGRTWKAADHIRQKLGVEIPVVCYNGAKVVIPSVDHDFTTKIPIAEARKIMAYGEERGLYTKVYVDDVLHIKEPDEKSLEFCKNSHIDYKVVGKLSENVNEDVNMIVVYYKEDHYGVLDEKLSEIDVTVTTSISNSIDVIPKGISKERGLRLVASHFGIESGEILAMGNSLNDIEMLRYAGIGIAMKNGDVSLLSKWSNVTEYTNNEDGVYHVLKLL
ncbi:Cof-type HAD-IIB family hydrolase [Youngiibacter fragilis]|uniref:Hydrolase n=1 Tax=Youngiibacter fragilis 232.1 TaxID=994573 RepID=V7I3H3_9CLOT|nr:Cof-type HAD-IIB family hydrolase [Youngiibacter fragilis]ETA80800.1 hypothetical protein T472_0209495 [Youngiibacter fragilis 232.1]